MKKTLVVMLAAFALGAQAADDQPRLYAATAPLTVGGGDGLQRLELPLPVLQASRSGDYADVRLFDAAGTPLPMAWAGSPVAAPDTQRGVALARFAWPASGKGLADASTPSRIEINTAGAVVRIVGAAVRDAAAAQPGRWLLDASAVKPGDERWQRIALDWVRQDGGVSTGVLVEASDDARQWRTVTRTALLELPGDANAPAQKHIEWPASAGQPKYLRLSFDAPLALTKSELVLGRAAAAPVLPSQRFSFAHDAQERAWTLDLQGRVPLARLLVHPAAPNTVVALRLEQRHDDKAPWQHVASFVAWRLVREGVESLSPALEVHAAPARHWRLVADARTPLPAAPLEATVEWRAPSLVFAARDGKGLQLAVGRDKSMPVALPIATLVPGHKAGSEFELPRASVGALTAQAPYTPGLPERVRDASADDKRRWLLWAVLAAAVAGLAFLAMRLAKDVSAKR